MATDQQRIAALNELDYNDAMASTDKMCKLIKKGDKAWNRAVIAFNMKTDKMKSIGNKFLDRAAELGHDRAKRLKKVKWDRYYHRIQLRVHAAQNEMIPVAEKIIKEIKKKTDLDCRISRMCSYPYWNNEGLFISIPFAGDDFDYSGYDPSGPSYLNNYRRQYLGKNLSKIATICNRYNVGLHKSASSVFIKIDIDKNKHRC